MQPTLESANLQIVEACRGCPTRTLFEVQPKHGGSDNKEMEKRHPINDSVIDLNVEMGNPLRIKI